MGAADAEEDERPVHRVYVSEFFIGRFPVTNDEYAKFVQATGYPAPGRPRPSADHAGRARVALPRERRAVRLGERSAAGRPRQPSGRPRPVRRRPGLLRVVVGHDRAFGAAADRSGMGKRRRAAGTEGLVTRGATTSTPRAEIFSPTRRPGTSAAPARPAPTRRTRTACTTSAATCGSGSRLVQRRLLRARRRATRAARSRATCGSCAAARGSTTMWRCCGARTGTRCRRTPTPTA